MLKYLKQYQMEDMREMMANNKTPHLCSDVSLAGKTAVMSGATSGVGFSAAEELARFHCNLVLVARNETKARAVKQDLESRFGVKIRYFLADFTLPEEVKKVSKEIADTVDRVDILINSAGIHSTKKIYTKDGFESVFCVNHLSPFILTYSLIPKLKTNPRPVRIIQVNSQGHRFNGFNIEDLNWRKRIYTGLRGYGASKTAQLLSVWEFADRLSGTNITINAMHPGEVKSNIGHNNGRFYIWYHDKILWKSLKDVKISGESLHYLASHPSLEGVTGKYFNRTHPEKPAPHALDREVGGRLWEKTLQLSGLSDEI